MDSPPHVGLLVTCLVDLFRPTVAWATVRLLEAAGCRVSVPEQQTCCGQPASSQGANDEARAVARQVIEAFAEFDYVVLPSGSCAATLRHQYPTLFADDPAWSERAQQLAKRTYELTSFLVDVLGFDGIHEVLNVKVAYHDSCHGYRELCIRAQPRTLLEQIDGLELVDPAEPETCCGFGGSFCVKYPEIAARMAGSKADAISSTGAQMVIGGDLGCLLNLAGTLSRRRAAIEVRHVAEVLAGMTDVPPIGGH